jgi:hypothetical protein
MIKFNYIRKALSFLHSEMELLKLKIQYPERFSLTEELSFKSELYVIPKAKGLGIIGLAELVMSIFLSKEVLRQIWCKITVLKSTSIIDLLC